MSSPTETAPIKTAPIKTAPPDTAAHPYRRLVARRIALVLGLSLLLCLSIAVDVSLGPARYALRDVAATLIWPGAADLQMRVVVWDIRLPMALMAVTVGGCLSLAGAQMQTILANPLASPFTLGLSAAASFGAALAMVLGVALFPAALALMVPINAFVMAMAAALLIFALSSMRGVTVETIVLLGIALVFTFNAALALLQYFASEQALAAVVFWTMGSLTKASWDKVAVTAAILVVCTPLFARRAWALTAIRLGEARASAMGVPVRRLRLETLILVSVLAAIPVSFVGTIGFIGIVGPHIARLLLGEDQRFFLPGAILSGALILSATSVLSKAILPGAVLPIGIITALVGVPFFATLIFTHGKRSW
jgi:iron complex transport system permease protein